MKFVDGLGEPEHLRGTHRGDVGGFSRAAARRMMDAMIWLYRPEASPYAVTLTTRRNCSDAEWESAVKRFRMRLKRRLPDWPAIWRVQVQERGAPHLHCVFWVDSGPPAEVVRETLARLWLASTGEEGDWASQQYAVDCRDVSGPEWACYVAWHNATKDRQVRWGHRHWGKWNNEAFVERPATWEGEISDRQRVMFCRRLRALSRRRFRGRLVRPLRLHASQNLPAFPIDERVTFQLLRGLVDDIK